MSRLPPHNEEAEEAVLGTLLTFGDHVHVATARGLTAGSFYAPKHQTIADAIIACATSGAADVTTVSEYLRRHDQLERVGGTKRLSQLTNATTWSLSYLPHYVDIVVDNSRRRQLIHDIGEATTAAHNSEPIATILTTVASAVGRLEAAIPPGFVTLEEVASKRIGWAWEDRIPIGEVTLLGGAEKVGKSLLCMELGARASRAQLAGDWFGQPIDVLYLTAEDRIAQVVKPRMVLAGANLHRVHVQPPQDGGTPVTVARIAAAIRGGVRFVVLDPLVLFLEGLDDENTDLKVRDALAPVIGLAQLHDAAIVGIKHTNKGEGRSIMNRIAGSRGYTAAVRSVLFVADDPDSDDEINPDRLIFARGNLSPGSTGARYGIEAATVELDDDTVQDHPRVVWKGESSRSLEDAFARSDHGRARAEQDVTDAALLELLAVGPVDATEAIEAIEHMAGVSKSTALRHLKELGGGSRHVGQPGSTDHHWEWWLPEDRRPSPKNAPPEGDIFEEPVRPSGVPTSAQDANDALRAGLRETIGHLADDDLFVGAEFVEGDEP